MALAKRRKILKIRLQQEGALSLEDSKAFIVSKAKGKRLGSIERENDSLSKRAKTISRRYNICNKIDHNARIYFKNIESSSESESDKT